MIFLVLVFLGGVLTILQSGEVGSRVFSIEFLDNDVQAYSFTFG